jgi:hypothetical protein
VRANDLREFHSARGVPVSDAYTFTLYLLAGLLAIGFVCNLGVRPVAERLFITTTSGPPPSPATIAALSASRSGGSRWGLVLGAWSPALGSLGWGVTKTLMLARQLFGA